MSLTRRQLLVYASATTTLLQLTPRFSFADEPPVRGGTLKMHIAIEPPILVNLTHTAGAAVYPSRPACAMQKTFGAGWAEAFMAVPYDACASRAMPGFSGCGAARHGQCRDRRPRPLSPRRCRVA